MQYCTMFCVSELRQLSCIEVASHVVHVIRELR
jgi:hypothetical protein